MFTLGGGTQHGNIGHNDHIVIRAHRQFFTEDIDFLEAIGEGAVVVLHNVHLFPGFTGK